METFPFPSLWNLLIMEASRSIQIIVKLRARALLKVRVKQINEIIKMKNKTKRILSKWRKHSIFIFMWTLL